MKKRWEEELMNVENVLRGNSGESGERPTEGEDEESEWIIGRYLIKKICGLGDEGTIWMLDLMREKQDENKMPGILTYRFSNY